MDSLTTIDPAFPRPAVIDVLERPENAALLEYVTNDPFGSHVFPGDIPDVSPSSFIDDLDAQLAGTRPIHLWSYIPTCSYRCRFCQYPVVIVKGPDDVRREKIDRWVDLNIAEAKLWLDRVPRLAEAPVGEFNVFGGTPSLIGLDSVSRLLEFYRSHFGFTDDTTIRFEGDPTTLTEPLLRRLQDLGCSKVSCGVQSFDDQVLKLSGREHTEAECHDFLDTTARLGYDWVTIDLMYGLLDQTVEGVARDLALVLEHDVPGVVCTKLHLRSYADTRTGVAGDRPAAWQFPSYRSRLEESGHHWPTLGEQYQMREVVAAGLTAAGYGEHPTMYFHRGDKPPERWKGIMVDQTRQDAEVAIGLGGSSSCRRSEAMTEVNALKYIEMVEGGVLPLASATRFGDLATESRAIKMALSTLQPLRDEVHRERFGGRSLFDEPWGARFEGLQRRGLLVADRPAGTVRLTGVGEVLVEAVMNTAF
ncbi:radical SAM protein [Kineosporia succinea]|uniref:Heme chaperone HemW n=1 Tax=Kineosporia succinea TaxID=84632 RepID=A0ABT9PF01_9ACTN|nr:radical SAM protein [Kineosporia succinea]MDP9831062.1 oxygen-independent coproporphyrinogen-3 oxidase [Kineosporia succinea]